MLTDTERGLTVEAVKKELAALDLQQATERDDLTEIQRGEKSALTEAHRGARKRLGKYQADRRGKMISLLDVLAAEASVQADTDSDKEKEEQSAAEAEELAAR